MLEPPTSIFTIKPSSFMILEFLLTLTVSIFLSLVFVPVVGEGSVPLTIFAALLNGVLYLVSLRYLTLYLSRIKFTDHSIALRGYRGTKNFEIDEIAQLKLRYSLRKSLIAKPKYLFLEIRTKDGVEETITVNYERPLEVLMDKLVSFYGSPSIVDELEPTWVSQKIIEWDFV